MRNPFSNYLNQWSDNPDFEQFLSYWDELEFITIRVYQRKMTVDEARPDFERVWHWLRENYEVWEGKLRPYWQQTISGGQPTQTDPFKLLIGKQNPEDILDDWTAMQHLPSAREALNQYILAQSKKS